MKELRGEALRAFVNQRRASEKSLSEIAAELGWNYKKLENHLYLARREHEQPQPVDEPAPFQIDLGEPWTLSGDFCVVGDVHVPSTDWHFAMLVAEVAGRYLDRPRRLLIGGDLFNMDVFSSFGSVVPPASWKQEKEASRALLRAWSDTFDEIYLILGNHDWRLLKWSMAQLDDDDLLTYLQSDRTRVSLFKYCSIETGNGLWHVSHARNYSINPLVVANDLANKWDANVITFHEHHAAVTMDRYNRHILVNGGSLADPCKLAYVHLDDSKGPRTKNGFVILRDGYPYLFCEGLTDWSKWI